MTRTPTLQHPDVMVATARERMVGYWLESWVSGLDNHGSSTVSEEDGVCVVVQGEGSPGIASGQEGGPTARIERHTSMRHLKTREQSGTPLCNVECLRVPATQAFL